MNTLPKLSAKKTAETLIKDMFPIENYEAIQDIRIKRLAKFIKYNVRDLIKEEKKLIAYGREVLSILKKENI